MASINTKRLVLGTLAAGVVVNVVESIMNIFVLAGTMEEMFASMNLPPMGGVAMGGFTVWAFVIGFLVVWI
ncbi:MAG: hypothetical protein HC812_11840, partial [Leptolyngbya sp. RL_3_1]|nr:hypothetical protein [Leptolyngbya sp. RL_3_1]